MIRTAVVGFLALLALLSAIRASDKPKKQTPKEEYRRLIREYQKAWEEFEEKKVGAFDNSRFAQGFLALAKSNPKTPIALDALTWIIGHVSPKDDPQSPQAQALRILLRDHVESEKMVTICRLILAFQSQVGSRKLLHAVAEKNPHRSAKAEACLTLAIYAESDISLASELKKKPDEVNDYEEFMGKEYVQALITAKPGELRKKVETLYERIAKDFADVPRTVLLGRIEDNIQKPSGYTFGELAKAKLEALRHPVAVGKPAPEMEGKDIEAKKFKLSDYRGKVVLLIFWWEWCGPDKPESFGDYFDYERSLVKRMKDKPFVLIGVNRDIDRGELKKVMIKETITWRFFLDGGATDGGPICTRWSVGAGSVRFLIDAKGVIRHTYNGYPDHKALDKDIDKLVAEVQKTKTK